ncbi:MAG: PIN domain nuclease [Kiritimatiellia bacterium]
MSKKSLGIEGPDFLARQPWRLAKRQRFNVIIVDTSVWIDFFHGKNSPEVHTLERILVEGKDVCICGVILAEVLQGIREDGDYRATLSRFESFLFLPMNQHTFVKAAELYRILRHKGITIRNTVDCMIAAVAIEHDIPLLHKDRDFNPIAEYCGLKTPEKPTKASRILPPRHGKS